MKKVLILDSDLHFANTLKMYFRKNEYDCVISSDANEIDSLITQHSFDLILCSTQIDHRSGMEVMVSLRAKLKQSGIPLVLITANNNLSMNANFSELDADAILHKPISFSQLLETVHSLSTSTI
jgi:DNA-binding response OmpR family regulator